MRVQPRLAAIGAVSLAALLLAPSSAFPAGPLPDLPPGTPALPDAPTVAVTPGADGGLAVEVGAGDTSLQASAGPGGLRLGAPPRGPGPGGGGVEGALPISTPGDRPGRSRPADATAAGPAVLFGPRSGAAGAAEEGRVASRRAGATASRPDRGASREPAAPAGRKPSRLPTFFEFIDRVPDLVKAGIVALALLALAVWAGWIRGRRRLERNAFVDAVTGIANAPAFDGLLAGELERARRYKRPLALLVLDVSEVHQGRLAALRDHRLRDVTATIQERVRRGNVVARLGASRFAVISPEATVASAETLARSLELGLEKRRLHVLVGTAERQPTDFRAADLLARAQAPLEAAAERDRRRALLRAA